MEQLNENNMYVYNNINGELRMVSLWALNTLHDVQTMIFWHGFRLRRLSSIEIMKAN